MAYIIGIIRWVITATLLLLAKLATYATAPFTACFIVHSEESETTGFPSLFPGKPRAFLITPFRWQQTHDAPVDEFWYGGYYKGKHTQKDYDNNSIFRWWMRVLWIWRNNCYWLAHDLGLSQVGLVSHDIIKTAEWRGSDGYRLEIAQNSKGQVLFELKGQYGKLEFRFGYGLYRYSPKQKAMLYVRIKKRKRSVSVA